MKCFEFLSLNEFLIIYNFCFLIVEYFFICDVKIDEIMNIIIIRNMLFLCMCFNILNCLEVFIFMGLVGVLNVIFLWVW